MVPDEVRSAVEEFAARIDALAPDPGSPSPVTVSLSPAAAHALVEALRSYRDPRDHGRCDQCGTGRLDETFTCTSCGQPAGLFGQLVRERLSRPSAD
ncbi:hypothetical protein Ais01nite_58530 [Asanoa ishikariensis]|uniref:Uncharacterized protein n=1 Tax=Asanoa ishikariensis TaxID=137265 RepID=A0A1H3PGY2_9ACTN|nr:hypothetical protein [Asanoa ishikariensis]GIF67818.1 hypothetical protein Ais01nite_58530 [Asanoa ishikariensis]SDZ00248.1 hypothetical protein SAMN05421684_2871 [Asanoa ishikariensis]